MISVDRLRALFHYNPETGVFIRAVATGYRGCHKAGTVAGHLSGSGYWYLRVDGRLYLAHRLAWLYVTGALPKGDVDHKNQNRGDNRFANLREATRSENMQNVSAARANSKTGVLGAYPRRSGYAASIKVRGAKTHLGDFATKEEAGAAYLNAKQRLHPFATVQE